MGFIDYETGFINKERMRYSLIILILLLSGCSAQKRIARGHKLIEKYPVILDSYITVKDSVSYKDTTIYRDTTIYDTLPGEYIIKSVQIPCPDIKIDPIESIIRGVKVRSWIDNGRLYQEVDIPDMVYRWRLDSAIVEKNRYEKRLVSEIMRPPPDIVIPKLFHFYRSGFFILAVLFIITIFMLILRK